MTNISNSVALVTGGSRGIGAGICQKLLEAGYRVAIGYHSQQQAAQALASTWPDRAMVVQIEIGSDASVQKAVAQVQAAWGSIGILVNNAAMGDEKPFLDLTDADWEAVFSINVLGAVRCIRHTLPGMREQHHGRIINISSIAGQWGGVYRVHYAVSKAALINLTRSLARLYSAEGITCNALAPGMVETDLMTTELAKPEARERLKAIPSGRLGTIEEVGAAVVYLASDEAAYITGQTLNLNGGMYFG